METPGPPEPGAVPVAQTKGKKKAKSVTSKYDFVKVRVWLGETHYVLSRFLISRMLTVTKIPHNKVRRCGMR